MPKRTKPPHEPTDADRNRVRIMVAGGFKQEVIGRVIGAKGISDRTLRKHYRQELDTGATTANAAIVSSLFRIATGSTSMAAPAAMFWAKCRMGWKEPAVEQLHGNLDGKPLNITIAFRKPESTDAG